MHPEISGRLIRVEEVLAILLGDCYLPRRAAAQYLGMSPRKLEGLGIERYRVGGMLYFRRSVLDRFMKEHAERTVARPALTVGLRGVLVAAKRRALADEKN
jgi:hypothetical protein